MNVFYPCDGTAVRGQGGLLKGVRGEKRFDDIVEWGGGLRFLCGFQALLDILFGARVFLREGIT